MLSTTFELSCLKKSFENSFNLIMKNIENLEYNANLSNNFSSYDRKQNVIIRKKFVDYLINGIDYQQAVEFLKIDFSISQNIIENVLKVEYIILQRKQLSQKIFCARLLSRKGLKVKDIARLLETSPATVRNYLKTSQP